MVGLTERTVQRWVSQGGGDDLRRGPTGTPRSKLSAAEEQQVVDIANSPEFSPSPSGPALGPAAGARDEAAADGDRVRVHLHAATTVDGQGPD